jgi:hypothetical protein
MAVNGRDCSLAIRTAKEETGIAYSEETIREAATLLREEASIEGDGACGAVRKSGGAAGCVVAPLTLGTAPLLFWLALGDAGLPAYVSETRNLYLYKLNLMPAEESVGFAVAQERGGSGKLYEGCVVTGFELRMLREQAVKGMCCSATRGGCIQTPGPGRERK